MKKLAIRIGVILAIVVACSMFFANTIVTITTAKVKYAQVGYTRFTNEIPMTGEIYYPKNEKITIEAARKSPIIVSEMYVRQGDLVAEKDIICKTRLSDGFSDALTAANEALIAANRAYMDNEVANIKLINSPESQKNVAKETLDKAATTVAETQAKLLAAAAQKAVLLGEDVKKWAETVRKSGIPELTPLMEDLLDAQKAYDVAQTALLDTYANSKEKNEVYEFFSKRAALQRDIDKAQAAVRELVAESEGMAEIRAPRSGYIMELALADGMTYDGSGPAYELSPADTEPVLRCDISTEKRQITVGMRADIKTEYSTIKAEISAIVREGVSKRYAHIPLTPEMIEEMGNMRSLIGTTQNVTVTFRAKETTSILPAAAVRSDGENKYYVLVAEEQYGGLWGDYEVARKMPVTVLYTGDKEVAVQEDLRYNVRPVYQENRHIEDGSRIMKYQN